MTSNAPPLYDTRERIAVIGARIAFVLGLASAVLALLAGPSYRTGEIALGNAVLAMRWAAYGALAAAAIALLVLGFGIAVRASSGRVPAVLALAIGLAVAAPLLTMYQRAQQLPKIHDISTDTCDPPAFVAVLPLRQGARNPVDYRPDSAAQQRKGYADIVPMRMSVAPQEAFARAERAARSMGWQIVDAAPAALRIEATDTTLLFGFKDDVVIRIRAEGAGSVVDVRSLSRVGGSDFGTNAKRVRSFLAKLAAG